jgi:hypothetical protein
VSSRQLAGGDDEASLTLAPTLGRTWTRSSAMPEPVSLDDWQVGNEKRTAGAV